MSDNSELNYLKARDDRDIIKLSNTKSSDHACFKVEGDKPSWTSSEHLKLGDLRSRIEPWLVALFQSEHLSLLAGAGLTHAVHHMIKGEGAAGMDGPVGKDEIAPKIEEEATKSAKATGRKKVNIEDRVRIANELLRGYEILGEAEKAGEVRSAIESALIGIAHSVLASERNIITAEEKEPDTATTEEKKPDTSSSQEEKREAALDTLVSFLASFASRTGTRDRLHIFTTNYDRLIELGSELAGIHLLDRFVGSLTPIFRSSRLDLDMHYNPPGIRGEPRYLEGVARFTKLHGSLDWVQAGSEIRRMGLPFGAEKVTPFLNAPGLFGTTAHRLMIYPNAAKDRETAGFPYVELFRDLAAAICRPNSCLVTYGYGFGDEHINRVIEDMLTIPSTHLVIISLDDPMGRMRELAEKRPAQVSLLIGPTLGNLETLTKHFLPKAAIDRATSRMSELLKTRFSTKGSENKPRSDSDISASDGGGE